MILIFKKMADFLYFFLDIYKEIIYNNFNITSRYEIVKIEKVKVKN